MVPSDDWQDIFFSWHLGCTGHAGRQNRETGSSVRAEKDGLRTEEVVEVAPRTWAAWTVQTRWCGLGERGPARQLFGNLEGSEGFRQASRRTPALSWREWSELFLFTQKRPDLVRGRQQWLKCCHGEEQGAVPPGSGGLDCGRVPQQQRGARREGERCHLSEWSGLSRRSYLIRSPSPRRFRRVVLVSVILRKPSRANRRSCVFYEFIIPLCYTLRAGTILT